MKINEIKMQYQSYKNKKDLASNKAIWMKTKKEKLKWADHGIVKPGQPKPEPV